MDDKILNCYKLIESVDKLSIKEYADLLKENNHDARNKFIIGFLPYIYQIALKVYALRKDEFSAYYDFEELFNDGIMLAIKLYDNFKYIKNSFDYSIFNTYCNYFRLQFLNDVSKCYFMSVSNKTYYKIVDVLKIKNEFFETHGYLPSIEELAKLSGNSVKFVKNVYDCINLENIDLGSISFEDELIDEICKDDLHDNLMKAMDALSEKEKDIIIKVFGFDNSKKSYSQIGEEYSISRARVGQLVSRSLDKMKEDSPVLKKYLRG